jgi:hypothetical protein
MNTKPALTILKDQYAICRFEPTLPTPMWATGGPFVSITRTDEELSIVCPESALPAVGVPGAELGWAGIKIVGPLDFGLTGIIAELTSVLAAIGITVFVVATYDTDYVFVRHESLDRAKRALTLEGYTITP